MDQSVDVLLVPGIQLDIQQGQDVADGRSTPESISVSTGSEELVQGVDPYPEQQYRLSIAWVYSALGDDLCDCLGAGLSSVPQSH